VIVVEDDVLLREGLVRLLEESGLEVVGSAGEAGAASALIESTPADVIVLDVRLPPTKTDEGLRLAREALARGTDGPAILVLSNHVEPDLAMTLVEGRAGGVGYLLKERVGDVFDFLGAVERVGRGGSAVDPAVIAAMVARRRRDDRLMDLTAREVEVLGLMAEGRSNSGIAALLTISERTVEANVARILSKLGLEETGEDHRRVLAVLRYLRV